MSSREGRGVNLRVFSTHLITAFLAAGIGWMLSTSRDYASSGPVATPHADVPPPSESVVLPLAAARVPLPASNGELPPPPREAAPSVKEALASLDAAIRNQPIYDKDDQQFEDKYKEASLEGLQAALRLVKTRVGEEQEKITDERMKYGMYEETISTPGQEQHLPKPSGNGITSYGVRQQPLSGGYMRVRTTMIPDDEYPEFAAIKAEQWWLMRKLRGKQVDLTRLMEPAETH